MNEVSFWSVRGVNPSLHKRYRVAYYEDKGRLNGVHSQQLSTDIHFLSEVLQGRIELEGAIDFEDYLGDPVKHARELERCNDIFSRKNESKNLSRLNLRNMSLEFINNIEEICKEYFGGYHGKRGHIVNMAMNLGLKMRSGVTKASKGTRRYAERVLKGDVTSPLHVEVKEGFKAVNSEFKALYAKLHELISGNKKKKMVKTDKKESGTLYKSGKAIAVMDDIKKYKKDVFSRNDYEISLLKLYKQGDDRTVASDLRALLKLGEITIGRGKGPNGAIMYKFRDNDLYDEFQGAEARRAFNEDFKAKYGEWKQVSKLEFKAFVERNTGLTDLNSIRSRLNALIDIGWLTPFGESDQVFTVHIN